MVLLSEIPQRSKGLRQFRTSSYDMLQPEQLATVAAWVGPLVGCGYGANSAEDLQIPLGERGEMGSHPLKMEPAFTLTSFPKFLHPSLAGRCLDLSLHFR